jgi:hypothetical protein
LYTEEFSSIQKNLLVLSNKFLPHTRRSFKIKEFSCFRQQFSFNYKKLLQHKRIFLFSATIFFHWKDVSCE